MKRPGIETICHLSKDSTLVKLNKKTRAVSLQKFKDFFWGNGVCLADITLSYRGVFMKSFLFLLLGFSLVQINPAYGTNCGGSCRGGGTARANVMLDSYIAANSIRRSHPVMRTCVAPTIRAVQARLPDLGNQLSYHLNAQRFVLVDDDILEQAADGDRDLMHRYGDRLVAVNAGDSPLTLFSRDFFNNPQMQLQEQCDAIIHEVLIRFVKNINLRSNQSSSPPPRISQQQLDGIIALTATLRELHSDPSLYSEEDLWMELLHTFGHTSAGLGATESQRLSSEFSAFARNSLQVCNEGNQGYIDAGVIFPANPFGREEFRPFLETLSEIETSLPNGSVANSMLHDVIAFMLAKDSGLLREVGPHLWQGGGPSDPNRDNLLLRRWHGGGGANNHQFTGQINCSNIRRMVRAGQVTYHSSYGPPTKITTRAAPADSLGRIEDAR
jgi:hypothetical protein